MPTSPAISPQMILAAYARGLFPMAASRDAEGFDWYTADPRAILPLDAFHVPRSLARRVQSGRFRITRDANFEGVIRACAEPRPSQPDTWINPQIIAAYTELHRMGSAHSVEAWIDPTDGASGEAQLVGGVYGVSIGGAFFGESMFSRATDASKVCLVKLVEHLRSRGYTLLDAQFHNPHLQQFGVIEVPKRQYLRMLQAALTLPVTWQHGTAEHLL